jgi:hypothetical protein
MKAVKIAIVMPIVLVLALVAGFASVPGFVCAQLVRFAAWGISSLTRWPYLTPKSRRLGAADVSTHGHGLGTGDAWE